MIASKKMANLPQQGGMPGVIDDIDDELINYTALID